REVGAAILQQNTRISCHYATAKAEKQALNQGHRVALAIHRAQIDRVAFAWLAWRHLRRRSFGVNARPLAYCVLFGKQLFYRNVYKIGVADIAVTISKGQLFRLDQQVQILWRLVAE